MLSQASDNNDFKNIYVKEEIIITSNGDVLHENIKKEPSDNQFIINTNPNSIVNINFT
jgi:hypothetical protein